VTISTTYFNAEQLAMLSTQFSTTYFNAEQLVMLSTQFSTTYFNAEQLAMLSTQFPLRVPFGFHNKQQNLTSLKSYNL
jgi:hypothetical protein